MTAETQPRIIINRHDGSIATVGNVTLGAATVSHNGITISIGDTQGERPATQGVVTAPMGVSVHDIAAGLRAAGAQPHELAVIFDLLRHAGALAAAVEIQ